MRVLSGNAVSLQGQTIDLAQYQGKVVLIVNTASACGFTPQYRALEDLHRRYSAQGLVVLGFPCNQFGRQEPANEIEIGAFCKQNYEVSFPLFAKAEVNGQHAHPLFRALKQAAPGLLGSQAIKWNFTKFLVDRHGFVHRRYAPITPPQNLEADIVKLLV